MWSNTKLLVSFSVFILFSGFIFLWFGLNPKPSVVPSPSPTPHIVENLPEATSSAVAAVEGEQALVTDVVDGDTIKVNLGGKEFTVRYVGMDTPETVDPRRPVGCFGKEASNENKNLVSGKKVILQKDVSETDKYKRLLRYVFLPLEDGRVLFVNDYLVREGFAKVYTYPPDIKYNVQFLDAQKQAREAKKGLWGRC